MFGWVCFWFWWVWGPADFNAGAPPFQILVACAHQARVGPENERRPARKDRAKVARKGYQFVLYLFFIFHRISIIILIIMIIIINIIIIIV